MKKSILTLAALTILSGCDAAQETMRNFIADDQAMSLVFKAGSKMKVDGKIVPIMGSDICPPVDKLTRSLYGPQPDEGHRSCVVIAPETKTVMVMVGSAERFLQETWAMETWGVERDGSKTRLRRADGSYVLPAD